MKSIYIAFFLFSTLLFTGCAQGDDKMSYRVDDLSDIKFEVEGGYIKLSYRPILETLYYSPGINYSVSGEHLVIDVVRCHINDECEVDEKSSQEDMNVVSIKIEKVSDPNKIFINEPKDKNSIANLASNRI